MKEKKKKDKNNGHEIRILRRAMLRKMLRKGEKKKKGK